jgi:Na+/H+ antiporter NhaD/arsenite permease-like protein
VLRGLVVFALTYALVAGRRLQVVPIDRPAGALVGAVLAVVAGAVTPHDALRAIDGPTIVLLFAVLGTGAFLTEDGFFERAAAAAAVRARSRHGLLAVLVWGAGLLSALITNDAVCVFGAPVVVAWIARHRLPRLPFLLALATAANTGSAATLVGNPQNMLCASLGKLAFAEFLVHVGPAAILGLAVNHAILALTFRRELRGAIDDEAGAATTRPPPVFTWRSRTVVAVLAATTLAYLAGLDLAWTAVGGFVSLMVLLRVEASRVWARIDWPILVFFAALFVAVEAVVQSGAPAWVFARVALDDGSGSLLGAARTAGLFLVGSNLVTNVPFILLVRPAMEAMPDATYGWEMLAMAATFAGNLTLLGSVANVIVAERARDVGGLGFREHLRVGAVVALATTLVGAGWLHLVHR